MLFYFKVSFVFYFLSNIKNKCNFIHFKVSQQRILAFIKRLTTLSLQQNPEGAVAYLAAVRQLIHVSWYNNNHCIFICFSISSSFLQLNIWKLKMLFKIYILILFFFRYSLFKCFNSSIILMGFKLLPTLYTI